MTTRDPSARASSVSPSEPIEALIAEIRSVGLNGPATIPTWRYLKWADELEALLRSRARITAEEKTEDQSRMAQTRLESTPDATAGKVLPAPPPEQKEHELKIWPGYFAVVAAGVKRFEIRKDDRGFHAGDTLWLREWLDDYTGRSLRARVTYITRGPDWGLPMGTTVMSIEALSPSAGEAPTVDAVRLSPDAETKKELLEAQGTPASGAEPRRERKDYGIYSPEVERNLSENYTSSRSGPKQTDRATKPEE